MDTGDKLSKKTLLENGVLKVSGRLVDASNATLFGTIEHGGDSLSVIYKPIAGERPLWDFAEGTLANREYASYLVSESAGFHLVPLTILRDGPFGDGMVQSWIDIDETIDLVAFFETDDPQLRKMALFDAIINNTDRKIGHLLPTEDGHLFGCDHGVTFHREDKLRTVLWQWAGEDLSPEEIHTLQNLHTSFKGPLGEDLANLLTQEEISALHKRVERLLSDKSFPLPSQDWPSVPWPAF